MKKKFGSAEDDFIYDVNYLQICLFFNKIPKIHHIFKGPDNGLMFSGLKTFGN